MVSTTTQATVQWTNLGYDCSCDETVAFFILCDVVKPLPPASCERMLPLKSLKAKVFKLHIYVRPRFMLLSSAGWR